MAEVDLTVNGRTYRLICQDGEEGRLRQLSGEIDAEVSKLSASDGRVGESRMLLMAALVIADERSELRERVGQLEKDFARLKDQEGRADASREEIETQLGAALQDAAERIQRIAKRIEAQPDGSGGVGGSGDGRLPF